MKHSFIYKEQKLALIALSLALCTLSSCNKHKVSSVRLDSICVESSTSDTTGVEETETELASPSEQQSTDQSSESTTSSSSSDASGSLGEIAYKAGYELAPSWPSVRDEEEIKALFVRACQHGWEKLERENATNRSMYKEFRRGFLKSKQEKEEAESAL